MTTDRDAAPAAAEGADIVPDALLRAVGYMHHLPECPTIRMHVGRVQCDCGMMAVTLDLMRFFRQMRPARPAPVAAPRAGDALAFRLAMEAVCSHVRHDRGCPGPLVGCTCGLQDGIKALAAFAPAGAFPDIDAAREAARGEGETNGL